MDAVTVVLNNHPMVQTAEVPVRFTKITDYSLDLDLFAYVATSDYNVYLKVQNELLLKLPRARKEVGWAIPIAESVNVNPPNPDLTVNSGSHLGATPPAELPQPD